MSEVIGPSPDNSEVKLPFDQRLLDMATGLGFIETPELRALREKCAPDQPIKESRKLIKEYQAAASKQTGQEQKPEGYSLPNAGLMIALASIQYKVGQVAESEKVLGLAHQYLREMGAMKNAADVFSALLTGYGVHYRVRE